MNLATVRVSWISLALTWYQNKRIQCYSVNVKLSTSPLNKLKLRIKNGTKENLNLSQNVIGNSKGKTHFPHKLLLIVRQVSRLFKTFGNN